MKGWLGQTTLATMKVALAGQKTFAEESLGALERAAFHKALMMCDQNVLDVVRVIEKVNVLRAEFEMDYVAVFFRGKLQIGKRITAERSEVAAYQLTFRARGIMGDCQQSLLLQPINLSPAKNSQVIVSSHGDAVKRIAECGFRIAD